jgi:hypothetical protein
VEALYKAYKDNDKVAILLVYVNEAHPVRNPKADRKSTGPAGIGRHRRIEDRVLAASKCMKGLRLSLPILIDGMDGTAERAYRGRPAATAVVDLEGKVVFHSIGPRGVNPREGGKHIKALLAAGGFPKPTPPATRPSQPPTTRPAPVAPPPVNSSG